MSRKDISIIIPCFNSDPDHLSAAINSVFSYKGQYSFEIIVINDGSTNNATLRLLNELQNTNVFVIHQENMGPSSARNAGVKQSKGDYLLCLDSDNLIFPEYIDTGIEALINNPKAAVVYGNPAFIGEKNRPGFITRPFAIEELLLENYIDMCTVVRKRAWENIGGLDENLIEHEDWEFWLRLYKAGWDFLYINKIMFNYRIRQGSLMGEINDEGNKKIVQYLYTKHWDLLYEVFYKLYSTSIIYENDRRRPFRSFIKYLVKSKKVKID